MQNTNFTVDMMYMNWLYWLLGMKNKNAPMLDILAY